MSPPLTVCADWLTQPSSGKLKGRREQVARAEAEAASSALHPPGVDPAMRMIGADASPELAKLLGRQADSLKVML